MQRFVELESVRGGDQEDDATFEDKEKGSNLKWFLQRRHPEAKLIYWEGRGSDERPLPTGVEAATVRLTTAGPEVREPPRADVDADVPPRPRTRW